MKTPYSKVNPKYPNTRFSYYECKYYPFKFSLRKNLTKEQLLDFIMKINPNFDLWFLENVALFSQCVKNNNINEEEYEFLNFIQKAGLFYIPSEAENKFYRTKPQTTFIHRKEYLLNSLLEKKELDLEKQLPLITEIPFYFHDKEFFKNEFQEETNYSHLAFKSNLLDKINSLLNKGFSNFGSSALKFDLIPTRFNSIKAGCWKIEGLNFYPNGYVFGRDTLGRYENFNTAFKFLKNLAKHCPYLKADFSFYGEFNDENQNVPYLNIKMFDGKIKFQKFNEKVHQKNHHRMIKNARKNSEIFENKQSLDFLDVVSKLNEVSKKAMQQNSSKDSLKYIEEITKEMDSKLKEFELLHYIINERAFLINQAVKKTLKQERSDFIKLITLIKQEIESLDKTQTDYEKLVKIYKDFVDCNLYFYFIV